MDKYRLFNISMWLIVVVLFAVPCFLIISDPGSICQVRDVNTKEVILAYKTGVTGCRGADPTSGVIEVRFRGGAVRHFNAVDVYQTITDIEG